MLYASRSLEYAVTMYGDSRKRISCIWSTSALRAAGSIVRFCSLNSLSYSGLNLPSLVAYSWSLRSRIPPSSWWPLQGGGRRRAAADADRGGHTPAVPSDVYTNICSLSLIHISEPTRLGMISYAVFCL